MPSIASTRASSSLNGDARTQAAPVGVDVLAQERDLAHALGGHALHLRHELVGRPRDLAPPRGGHDAVRAHRVAPDRDLHPPVVLARTLLGEPAGEALELEVALRGQRVRGQELGQLVHLPGAEGDVDEREAAEDLVLDRLGPAAAHPDHPVGVAALERARLAEVGHEALVGLLADRAGVEQDQVGVGARLRLRVAERLEHALHALGVVRVHLAPERRHVVALHAPQATWRIRPRATPG